MLIDRQGGTKCQCCGAPTRQFRDDEFCFDCYCLEIASLPTRQQNRMLDEIAEQHGEEVMAMVFEAVSQIEVVPASVPQIHRAERWAMYAIQLVIMVVIC